jgi:GT2 family glycosyltransferase
LNNNPKIVVVTLNYNQFEYTKECINSLLNSDYNNFEIILIDNGSSVDNYEIFKKEFFTKSKNLKIIREEVNLGYVGGINIGLKESKKYDADYIMIMNNDTIIDSKAISNLLKVAEKYERKAIVSGKVYNYDEKETLQYIGQRKDPEGMLNQISIVKNRRELDVGQYEKELELGMLDDIYWLMPAKLYDEIGGYSDYFFLYGEQNDYALHAIKKGYKLIYTPSAKLWHKGGATTCNTDKKSAKIQYWTTMGTLKLSVLHFSSLKAKKFYWNWIIRQSIKNIIYFIIGRNKFTNLKAHFIAIKHFNCWNEIRYKDNGYNPFK